MSARTTPVKTVHVCTGCGTAHPKWTGRCTTCRAWNSLVEQVAADERAPTRVLHLPTADPIQIHEVDVEVGRPRPTGLGELDRVLGGGIVPGSVTLLAGEPGIGKSTLLLQLLAWWPGRTLYVTGEESAQQVRARADRLGAVRPDLWLQPETSLTRVLDVIDTVRPDLVVVDSVQTLTDPALSAPGGSVTQVRACAHRLVLEAKSRDLPIVMVGHVTKEGGIAGPRVLEHVVDTVLSFEGHRHHALRLLRAVKHRFGPTGELGMFEMVPTGLVGVPDASRAFVADRRSGVAGSAIVATVDGQRPIVLEVQALTVEAPPQAPARRTSQGVDAGRLSLLLAVLQRRAGLQIGHHDVYVSTTGGTKSAEPGLDLGICVALASAATGTAITDEIAVFGEVGLGGELRQVGHAERRMHEAARLGFTRAVVPAHAPDSAHLAVTRVATLAEALRAVGL